jgi:hypothetical protein
VTFSTTAGTFSAVIVNTDFSGTARSTLTTSREASVTASAGGTTSTAVNVTVLAQPTVSISVTNPATAPPTEGGITTFSIVANPAAGGAPIQNVVVNYGDGSSNNLGAVSGTLTVQHVYTSDGTFTPSVTVTDTAGTSVTASTVFFVQPLLVSIQVDKDDPSAGATSTTVTFTVTASVPVASSTWSFGDDTSPQTVASASVTHIYPNTPAKTYTVSVVVRTVTNETVSGRTTVRIP